MFYYIIYMRIIQCKTNENILIKQVLKVKKNNLKEGFFPTLSMLYNNYTNNVLHPD